jgi:hypothetical protein
MLQRLNQYSVSITEPIMELPKLLTEHPETLSDHAKHSRSNFVLQYKGTHADELWYNPPYPVLGIVAFV